MKFDSSTTRLYVQVGVASTPVHSVYCLTHRRTDSALRGTAINNLSNRVTRLRILLKWFPKSFVALLLILVTALLGDYRGHLVTVSKRQKPYATLLLI